MDEPTQNPNPNNSEVTPIVNPVPSPAPKELTPEEKKVKRAQIWKRLKIISLTTYLVLMVFVFVWALLSFGKDFTLFDFLPLKQNAFSNFVMGLFHVLMGILVGGTLLMALWNVLKSLLAKREEIDKKKAASKKALIYGIAFFLSAVLWLLGIWFLGPRLVTEQRYGSPIITAPENTIGLTSPVTVTFDASQIPVDTDVYSILSYTWNFGDGNTGNDQVVTHQYTRKATGNGIYTVTLNVEYMDLKSGARFDYETTVDVSIANEQTAASFIANPDSGEIPLTVTFDASSSFDPDGEIVSYEWDFDGDGRFDDAEGEVVDYTFTQEGSYEVTLRVTDNNGDSVTTSQTVEAGSVGGLRSVITAPLAEGEAYYVGTEYDFDGKLSQIREGKIIKYTWDFGDGTRLQSRSVSHSFESSGPYEISLTVADANGNTDETTLGIQVLEEGALPSAKIETDPELENGVVSGPVPLTVAFDGSSSYDPDGDIVDYQWDFESDGIMDDTGDKTSYTYEEMGDYEATLTTVDSVGNTDQAIVSISVTEQGVLAVLEADVSNGEVPLTVRFDASGSSYKEGNVVSYEYDFGDDSEAYVGGSSVTYRYNDVGTFTITLTVVGDDGSKDSTTLQVVVRPVSLTACFTVNTDSGNAPLFVAVDPSCSEGTIESYGWDFGDGELSFDRKPGTHTYEEKGSYTITLEVTADSGIVDTFTKTITVK